MMFFAIKLKKNRIKLPLLSGTILLFTIFVRLSNCFYKISIAILNPLTSPHPPGIFLFIVFFILVSCTQPNQVRDHHEEMDGTMKQPNSIMPDREWNVGFLMVDGVYNTELIAPIDIFQPYYLPY